MRRILCDAVFVSLGLGIIAASASGVTKTDPVLIAAGLSLLGSAGVPALLRVSSVSGLTPLPPPPRETPERVLRRAYMTDKITADELSDAMGDALQGGWEKTAGLLATKPGGLDYLPVEAKPWIPPERHWSEVRPEQLGGSDE